MLATCSMVDLNAINFYIGARNRLNIKLQANLLSENCARAKVDQNFHSRFSFLFFNYHTTVDSDTHD